MKVMKVMTIKILHGDHKSTLSFKNEKDYAEAKKAIEFCLTDNFQMYQNHNQGAVNIFPSRYLQNSVITYTQYDVEKIHE